MSLLIVSSLTSAWVHFFLKYLEHGSQEWMGNRAEGMAEVVFSFRLEDKQVTCVVLGTVNASWRLVAHCRLDL